MRRVGGWLGLGLLVSILAVGGCASSHEEKERTESDVEDLRPVPPEPDPELVAQGEKLFAELNCGACHRVSGSEEPPRGPEEGPDLAGIGLKRTESWLRSHILNPRPHKVDSPMPGFAVTDDQLDAIVAYLESLR